MREHALAISLIVALAAFAPDDASAVTFTVNANADTDDGTCDAANCTLREAINAANASPGADSIAFNIGAGGAQTIALTAPLPVLSETVALNGATQPGFSGSPLITLDGTGAGAGSDGLVMTASGCSIEFLVITGFSGNGIEVTGAATGVGLGNNSIFGNGALGIDLGADGVTPNDSGDGDSGPNNLLNFPLLECVGSSGAATVIGGSFNGPTSASFSVFLFQNVSPDPSGFGEGQIPLGSVSVTTDATGNAAFTASLGPASASQVFTALAVDSLGNTSEFSAALAWIGDLDLDGTINAGDAVILANFLVGNVIQGAPPFNAPLASADLNQSVTVNAGDAVLLANYLVGNLNCLPIPAAPNQVPTAVASVLPTSGTPATNFAFSGAGSFDSDGVIVSYAWDFDDTQTATGQDVSHTYASAGTYNAVLTVTDDLGATDSAPLTVQVTNPPADVFIDITGFSFVPASITVPAGTTIIWTNLDNFQHTVTGSPFDSPALNLNDSYSYTTSAADIGTIPYVCVFHAGMSGSVTVE